MKIKKYIAVSVLFLTIIACVIPGLSQPAAPIDPSTIPTIVVLTANAAITQTAAVAPRLVPTETTTPDPSAVNGTVELLPDGSTKYTDQEVGFEITYPAGWLTLRPNSEEFNSAFANEAKKNDMLHDQMELDLNGYEAGVDRLYSYPLRPDIEKNFAFGFSNAEWDPDDPSPVDDNSMVELIQALESSGAIPGFRVVTAQVYENSNQVKLIEVGGQFTISNDQGGMTPFYFTAVFFKPGSRATIRISFAYLKDYKQSLGLDVMSVIDSIKLLAQ
jgi:hypothetical protein